MDTCLGMKRVKMMMIRRIALFTLLILLIACSKKTVSVEQTASNQLDSTSPSNVIGSDDNNDSSRDIDVSEKTDGSEFTDNIEKDNKTINGFEIIELDPPLVKFVKTDDGSKLNYRKEPVDGQKLGQFFNDTKLKITKKTNETVPVDGINESWYYAISCEDASSGEGWVFGGYLSDDGPIKDYLKKDEINLNWLIGSWENENSIIRIRSDGTFRHGYKESEGFDGTWSILDDGTLYISDCQIYDEDPWNTTYKIKACLQDRLTLIAENGWVCDLHNLKSQ
jgi:hypothetical protein